MKVKCVVMKKVNSEQWNVMIVTIVMIMVMMLNHAMALTGPNVCTEKQKYNITKRIKYMAPVSVRSYEWCMAMPPRCSKWTTEMRQLTRLENEERTAEVEVCCAGYKIKDIKCVPICPNGKTGIRCSLDCPPNKWGPNCVYECRNCTNQSYCSPISGECVCRDGWKGERCDQISMLPTTATTSRLLITRPISYIPTTSLRPSTVVFTTLRAQTIPTTDASLTSSVNTSPSGSTTDSTEYSPTVVHIIREEKQEDVSERNNSTANINGVIRNTDIEPDTTAEMFNNTEDAPTVDVVPTTATNIEGMQTTAMATKEHTIISSTLPAPEVTVKPSQNVARTSTTKKFKPKEIWIKPAQKGDSLENKQFDLPIIRFKNATNRENIFTTPKTIVVSIIPTSIATHKRTPLSVTSTKESSNNSDSEITKSMSMIGITTLAPIITSSSTVSSITSETVSNTSIYLITEEAQTTERNIVITNTTNTELMHVETSTTNSMKNETESNVTTNNSSSSTSVTRISDSSVTINPSDLQSWSTTERSNTDFWNFTSELALSGNNSSQPRSNKTDSNAAKADISVTEPKETKTVVTKLFKTDTLSNVTNLFPTNPATTKEDLNSTTDNQPITNSTTASTTTETNEDHTFHLLTEPEHITAVIGDKAHDRSSVDLIHVLSIAGGVMMALITVAVVIVMVERCRKTRFDEEDKDQGMRMKVVLDNDGPPPPYVRSIFHTPLPEPPVSRDKCHYQPISTLDRNLKQFMRPVVVQSISPIMIENFRGILECHYDHLPRRSHCSDLSQCEMRCSLTPSVSTTTELFSSRAPSVCTTVTIDTLKREAKFDEIDSTTSEPLYAEIPCWKPPLEHAVEIMNMNGEAVTEL